MDPKPSQQQLRQQEQEQLAAQQQTKAQGAREFATPEELLRADAAQTTVPPVIEERLQRSLEAQPKAAKSWWARWFGR